MKKSLLLPALLLLLVTQAAFSQWNYGSAFSTDPVPSAYVHLPNQQNTTFMFDSLTAPYPTNNWFTNLILPNGAWGTTHPTNYDTVGYFGAFPHPYCVGFAWNHPSTLHTSPYTMLKVDYSPYKITLHNNAGSTSVVWPNSFTFFFGSIDSSGIKPFLKKYDDLSATLRWRNTANPSAGYMEAPLVRGMPYFSMYYQNFRPLIAFPSPDLVSVNGHNVLGIHDSIDLTGTRFQLLLNGDSLTFHRQIWMLYSTTPVTLRFKHNKITMVGTSYTGYLRMAYVSTQGRDPHYADTTQRINLLDRYARFVPTGGTVSAGIGTDTSRATLSFNFSTSVPGNDSLMMMALPHHIPMLANSNGTALKFKCIKGTMNEVFGKTWNMNLALPDIGWESPNGSLNNVPVAFRDSLHLFLQKDVDSLCGIGAYSVHNGTNTPASDIYGFGKTSARLARLAVIADELSTWYPDCITLAQKVRDTLKYFVNAFINGKPSPVIIQGQKKDSLLYDTRYGGMISSLSYQHGYYEDFGNALYNDHHFHYGYFTYTAAAIARKDQAWAISNAARILPLLRDIANPSSSDPWFPRNRLLDWYDGNSWAKGLEGTGAGRNQESSSEATNAWYSIFLYGKAIADQNIKNTGKIMLASEILAAQYYYHIDSIGSPYPEFYTNNWKIVGNLWNASIDNQTFFGILPRYVYGIHVIPATPATRFLWKKSYASYVYNHSNLAGDSVFATAYPTPTHVKTWTTICFPIQAMPNINQALAYFRTYSGFNGYFDAGASKTNTYYWLTTYKYDLPVGTHQDVNQRLAICNVSPNPFLGEAVFSFEIPENSPVNIAIYNSSGVLVKELLNQRCQAGRHQVVLSGQGLPSGIYFYRLTTASAAFSGKIVRSH